MSQMGFPKIYDSKKVVDVIKKFYGQNFEDIEMILLYGSKKPFSDIDLFIVSKNDGKSYSNGWLDIYEVNTGEFVEGIERLDISVTDPVMTGTLIYGNPKTYSRIKEMTINMPISQKSIMHNKHMASAQLALSERTTDQEIKLIGKNYNRSYLFNSISLSQGIKLLTLENIEKEYGKYKHK
jgi:hypothetical protein